MKKRKVTVKYYENKSLFKDDYSILTPWAVIILGVVIVALLCVGFALLLPPEYIIQP